jgi:hypothetical protein
MHAREIMDDKLLTRLELARRWKVSIDTLKRRERAKILRPVRLDGRIIRYRMSDVLRIEEEGYGAQADVQLSDADQETVRGQQQ